jgi:hypothetical protein
MGAEGGAESMGFIGHLGLFARGAAVGFDLVESVIELGVNLSGRAPGWLATVETVEVGLGVEIKTERSLGGMAERRPDDEKRETWREAQSFLAAQDGGVDGP